MKFRKLIAAQPFSPFGLVVIAAAVVLVVLAWLTFATWQADRRAGGEARVGTALSGSRATSAAQATETIAAGAERDAATDRVTLENAHDIDAASGARAPIDPAVSRAGAVSLCKRAAYRGRPECVQLLGSGQPSPGGPRR